MELIVLALIACFICSHFSKDSSNSSSNSTNNTGSAGNLDKSGTRSHIYNNTQRTYNTNVKTVSNSDIHKVKKNISSNSIHFHSKVAGVTVDDRQLLIRQLRVGQMLEMQREPLNAYDPCAISLLANGQKIGYLKKEVAAQLSGMIDSGEHFTCLISNITGGGNLSYGVNIEISGARNGLHSHYNYNNSAMNRNAWEYSPTKYYDYDADDGDNYHADFDEDGVPYEDYDN